MFRFTTVLIIAAATAACQTNGSSSPPDTSSKSAASAGYATRSVKGDISLELTPRVTSAGLVVSFHPETHSGDLAEIDLAKTVRLEADGKTYEPVGSTAMSGHHGDGSVIFDVKPAPQRFAITISDVRGSGPLRFEWP